MTSYLIISLLDPYHASRIEHIAITAENQNALLQNYYPECLVIDLAYITALSKSQAVINAINEQNIIDLALLCTKHQHACRVTQLQPMIEAGTGLFLSAHASLDPASACFIYSGHYGRYDTILRKQSDKALQINLDTDKILITAEGQRAGFIQHLPAAQTVPEDLAKEKSATENLFNHTYFVRLDPDMVPELKAPLTFPLRCLVPETRITANDTPLLLGFNYSPSYWAARKRAPLFFHPDGTLLSEQPYLFLLHTAAHNVTIAYATRQALADLCGRKYFFQGNARIDLDYVTSLDIQTRFLAVRTTNNLSVSAL